MEFRRQVFSVDLLERYAAKGHGVITCMASGNDVIVLGTSTGWLIRHDFGGGDSYDIDLSTGRPGDQSIHRVFVDPGGSHCIATVVGTGVSDTYYMHAKWSKPRVLGKLKGLVVNTVAWNRQLITEASTREVILGTDNGQLHEIAVDEKDKREKYIKFLFELSELPEAFEGLQMETASLNNGTRYYVMAVTPTRLYSFTGIGSPETVFASYLDRAVHFMELPGEIPNSELHFFIKQRRAVHFAWLSGAGIYHGGLNFGAQNRSPNGDENFVENKALLDYSKLSDGGEVVKPSSIALSEFHFLLLIGNRVKVVNRISEQIVEELRFDQTLESASKGIIGLSIDASAGLFYAYDEDSIFQVSVTDEDRDMWKVYLDLKEYAAALANCSDPFQRDQVYLEQAETAFSARDFFRASSFFAKINYALSFEEITLKFISIGEQDALRTFLLRKLDNLVKEDKCQIMMISTWATELYLDKINRLLLEDDSPGNRNSEYQSIIKEFRAFLSDSKDVLDEATTMKLLESYGRVDELVYFASLKEQHEIVVHHYIQQGEAKRALVVLQKPGVSVDLQYKFAPDLIMLDAYETVESWMTRKDLNPRKLIPAMMSYSSEPHAKNETHEVIKYLEFCVHRLQNEDPGVHNLLLSLYAKKEDDSALLRFLQCKFGKGRSSGPDFFYDPKYALRLCLKEKRMRACVHIYSMMFMHEEAVALALQVDPELAMAEADKVEDDEDLRKKLWLMVAKHVVEQEKGTKRENIRKAIAFLKETDGLLKIEDILPFFPDFALIDDFKEAICSSLEDYNQQIEKLKEEMNDATHGADNIRNDISALAQRYAVVDRDEECGGAELMNKFGINVPKGVAASSAADVRKAIQSTFPNEKELVVKSQILAGGRGLGKFTSGLQGGVHIVKVEQAEEIAGKMLGQTLVTKQTGPQGKVVSKVYLCEKVSLVNEMYFAITLDRTTAGPLIIACQEGGTSIEDLAEKFPDMIIKVPIDVFKGITDEDAAKVVDGLAPKVADRNASIEQVKKLYNLFRKADCTQLEINPIAETSDNKLVAADAKLNFDDNAAFRQKEIFALRDPTQEDPREVAAAKADLNYIGLDGEIGCMVNGAGLAMATMDIIKLHGGTPANFLDVGGNASEGQVVEAFKILTADVKVKAILVNIFGGIMKCDVIASGIVNAAKHVALKVPVVVRLEGTNVDQGKMILKESGMTLITAEDLDDAAQKAVKALR